MADTIKSTNQLKLVASFVDDDTRTITLDDPSDTLTAADIYNLANSATVLVGDRAGAPFHTFTSAKVVAQTVTYLDLTSS